jgi:hypothetical protein
MISTDSSLSLSRVAVCFRMASDAAHELPPTPSAPRPGSIPPGDPEAALRLLEEWMKDESGYDEQTLPALKVDLDHNRSHAARKLFDE